MSELHTGARDIADAKAWFYLDHRDDIETWAALRREARELLDRHLVGLSAPVGELAEELNAELETEDLESGSWPRIALRRAIWQHHGIHDVTVTVQWERARLLAPGSNEWPYVAVRVPSDADESRRRLINEAMKPVRRALDGQISRSFPCWNYVRSPKGAPLDPETLTDAILADLWRLWEVASPVLDDLHG